MDTLIVFGAKYLIVLSLLLALYAFLKLSREQKKEMFIFGLFTLPLAYVLGLIARHLWYDPRPFVTSGLAPLIAHVADNGFPSDHMLLAAALAAVVGYSNKRLAACMWLIAILIGSARVLAGVHHAADIIGSILIVLTAKWIAYAIIRKLWNKNNQTNS